MDFTAYVIILYYTYLKKYIVFLFCQISLVFLSCKLIYSIQFAVCCRRIPSNKDSLHPVGCRSPYCPTSAPQMLSLLNDIRIVITQTPRRETYYPCEGLISRAFNGNYSIFYHNYFIFSQI